jgi:two-component system sensor histidine kinase DegS
MFVEDLVNMGLGELPVLDHTDYGIRMLEEERRRIARDLHDGPAQALTNISMRLGVLHNLMASNPERATVELDRINRRLIEVINEVRRLIYDLRPVAIDEVGLRSAIGELCGKYRNDWRIPVKLSVAEDVTDDIAPARQVAVYQLVKEILNNVAKHAEATEVTVGMRRSGADLVVEVCDNGKGFDPSAIPAGRYGIIGMRERARYLGGSLDIQSKIGNGSKFTIQIPVYQNTG